MQVNDTKIGVHHHIDHVYVLRARSGNITAQQAEVSHARWAHGDQLAELDTSPELPALSTTPPNGPKHAPNQDLTRSSPARP